MNAITEKRFDAVSDAASVARNTRLVLERIRLAAARAGRPAGAVRLVAATKMVSAERIIRAMQAGVTILGESRVQEALPKIEAIGPRPVLAWHFLGRLQRRKARLVAGRFALIHSLDSLDLARELDRRAAEAGVTQAVLIEVNLGGEASKAGFSSAALPEAASELDEMLHLDVRGLMAVPPPGGSAEEARPYFRALREHAAAVKALTLRRVRMDELSMGMSMDYEVAVEEGATLVRVGTAIFGSRT